MKEFNLFQPYVLLAESLGRFQAQLVDKPVSEVRIEFAGEIVDLDAAPVTRAFLAGLLRDVSARVNVVNAFLIAEERGIKVTTTYVRTGGDMSPAIRTEICTGQSTQSLAGTLFGYGEQRREGRITEIDGFHLEATPHGHMLVTRNHDVPGVIGGIGTILGQGGVNISRFHLGRRERGGEAMAVIEVDAPLNKETLQSLRSLEQVISAQPIDLKINFTRCNGAMCKSCLKLCSPSWRYISSMNRRIDSIDLLRGIVMVIMMLDHTRDFVHNAALQFDPTDLSRTNIALFLTRWITHFCAPVFVFLAGTGAYLQLARGKSKAELSRFLVTRGLWLIFLELTVVKLGVFFNSDIRFLGFLQVIWVIGMSMIVLAALIYLPKSVIAAIRVVDDRAS